jgi:hypothetical protein
MNVGYMLKKGTWIFWRLLMNVFSPLPSFSSEIKHAARVLFRYHAARRTRILRIRLWLTVRAKKEASSSLNISFTMLPEDRG